MKEFTENAMKFTLDGNLSVYDYKDEEIEPPTTNIDLKAIIGMLQEESIARSKPQLFIEPQACPDTRNACIPVLFETPTKTILCLQHLGRAR